MVKTLKRGETETENPPLQSNQRGGLRERNVKRAAQPYLRRFAHRVIDGVFLCESDLILLGVVVDDHRTAQPDLTRQDLD